MTAPELLAALRACGAEVRRDGGDIVVRAKRGAVPMELRAALVELKAALVTELRQHEAAPRAVAGNKARACGLPPVRDTSDPWAVWRSDGPEAAPGANGASRHTAQNAQKDQNTPATGTAAAAAPDDAADLRHPDSPPPEEAQATPELLLSAGLAVDLSAAELGVCDRVAERFAAMAVELLVPVREPVPGFTIDRHWSDVHFITAMPVAETGGHER